MAKPMRVYYDTEFHEDGKTIDLISIGMLRDDGKTFYAVSKEADYDRVAANPWLMDNVMNSIDHHFNGDFSMVITDPAAMSRNDIKLGILDFVSDIWPEFWAWYGAYDHVALAQLFGKMIDLPPRFPMFTCDIRQLFKDKGQPLLPAQEAGKHNALADATHNKVVYDYLTGGELIYV